jgi:hypothetical protein
MLSILTDTEQAMAEPVRMRLEAKHALEILKDTGRLIPISIAIIELNCDIALVRHLCNPAVDRSSLELHCFISSLTINFLFPIFVFVRKSFTCRFKHSQFLLGTLP